MVAFTAILTTALAAGESGNPPALIRIDGREALLRSVELLLNRNAIKQILLAFTADQIDSAKERFGAHLGFSGVKLVTGGPGWLDQAGAAAEKVLPESTHVLVHDAARPAVPYSDIDRLLELADDSPAEAAVLAAPVPFDLVELDEAGVPVGSRSGRPLRQLLSPRWYRRSAFDRVAASKQDVHPSALTLLNGSPLNVRLTAGDTALVKAMMSHLPKPKVRRSDNPFEEAQW